MTTRLSTPRWDYGVTVYSKLDPTDDTAGMITGYTFRPGSAILYHVARPGADDEALCYEFELTDEKSFVAPGSDDE